MKLDTVAKYKSQKNAALKVAQSYRQIYQYN